jgi:6,7-dimethyl-8-ribityllumazine synthase
VTWPGERPAPHDEPFEEAAEDVFALNGDDEEVEPAVLAAPADEAAPEPEETELEETDEPEPEEPGSAEEEEDAAAVERVEHAPGDLDIPDGIAVLEGTPRGGRRGVGIVAARFNGEFTNRLLASALDELDRAGIAPESITVMPVPGAFELPLAAMALAKTRRFACIVALGCVIRGETAHFEYVAGEAASGLQLAALETGVPVAFGVLTVDTPEQADARVDKGAEAVRTALEMADLFAHLRQAAQAGR